MFGWGKAPEDEEEKTDAEIQKDKEEAIHQLLALCAANEVDVPADVRNALLGDAIVEKMQHGDDDEEGHGRGGARHMLQHMISSRATDLAEMEEGDLIQEIRQTMKVLEKRRTNYECRVVNGSYRVTNKVEVDTDMSFHRGKKKSDEAEEETPRAKQNIDTVVSANPFAILFRRFAKAVYTQGNPVTEQTKVIAEGINLNLKGGKMYLVLGLPGSGKSTVLKMMANTLRKDKAHEVGGQVSINGMSPDDKKVYWTNLAMHIDQIDRLHPFLTVWETCKFAFDCRFSGHHGKRPDMIHNAQTKELIEQMNKEKWMVTKVLQGMGLLRVSDTFVGDQTTVRGVSGGEKKRVTVAELVCVGTPVMCCDEISTGLDAATTYDIVKLMGDVTRLNNTIKVISLLQPPPETVALFDELILVDGGEILYAGPLEGVVEHFESMGYYLPDRTDVADWLLALPTQGGKDYLKDKDSEHLSASAMKQKYNESPQAQAIKNANEQALSEDCTMSDERKKYVQTRYHNSWLTSLRLLVSREMLLWWRDRYQIRARIMQDIIMGVVAGTVFWQQNDDPTSVMGILFQSMFFVSVGAMLKVPSQFEPRSIFYKHQDANFFPTWTYVLGRSVAGFPTSLIDGVVYGSIIYWFVGLTHSDGAANFFVFMLLILAGSMSSGLVFSIFSATVKDKSMAQACMSVCVVLLVLFSGFTVQPDVIPVYWIWAYWINVFGWILRSLIVNEYTSSKYSEVQENGDTYGENILSRFGFVDSDGVPYTSEWVWWGFLFSIAASLLSIMLSTFFLDKWRFETGRSLATDIPDVPAEVDIEEVEIPFQKVNLCFDDIHYTVKASTTDEYLELLKGVDGYVEAGKMTALMGSSGAGKTTLMDCLSLRKTSGEITGDVTLNGHKQEPLSFRRCTGYVEQFDTQSPALTIRETVDFSAKLRLDESDKAVTDESIKKFVDQTLAMLELDTLQDLQVGSDLTGGLSFEQKKRLSIAVELVANPSILFLDEPTSGLDARAAGIVMRGLKRIALTGRAVCATIHQPSIAIFNSFDSLLLLKRGGEVVFFGELGNESCNLIAYLERYEATPKIEPGENPATWMLTCIGAGSASQSGEPFDYAGAYRRSKLRTGTLSKIEKFTGLQSDDNLISYGSKFATSKKTQRRVLMKRIMKVYWRSPSYNMVRLLVSAIVAFLFGSVYASQRIPENESDMNSRVTSIFITFLFLAVNAFNTVLAVFETERNMFYRHKAALMYEERALLMAFSISELPFIFLAAMVFCVCFYFLVGFSLLAYKFFLYFLFFFLNIASFTFLGQMMVALVRDSQTAQGFGGLLVGMTSLFSGLLIRPNNISGFWTFAYWLFPGHYVLEGLLASQFHQDETPIEATPGSPFYEYLGGVNCTEPCEGSAEEWIKVSFGGEFRWENIPWNILYLLALTIGSRLITWIALVKLNYLAK